VVEGIDARQERGVRWARPGRHGNGVAKERSRLRQPVDRRRRGFRIAVGSQVIGPNRVERDEDEVCGGTRCEWRLRGGTPARRQCERQQERDRMAREGVHRQERNGTSAAPGRVPLAHSNQYGLDHAAPSSCCTARM
jgi:hypothetical protein